MEVGRDCAGEVVADAEVPATILKGAGIDLLSKGRVTVRAGAGGTRRHRASVRPTIW
jgi:hypothetical protein